MAEVRAKQLLKQDQLMEKIDVSRASNDKLQKTNDELRRCLQQFRERYAREQGPISQLRARPRPFSQAIMDTIILTNFMIPKIVFTGVEDPEIHLTTFNAQMMISGGTNVMHCKMFMGTFIGTTLQWFVGLLDSHITSFDKFSGFFREQFIVNQAQPPVSFNLFGI